MNYYDNPDFLFSFEQAAMPTLAPAPGSTKLWEMEEDNSLSLIHISEPTRPY